MTLASLASEEVRSVDAATLAIRPRLAMSHDERLRYFENIACHRPHELELLRWNHDRPQECQPLAELPPFARSPSSASSLLPPSASRRSSAVVSSLAGELAASAVAGACAEELEIQDCWERQSVLSSEQEETEEDGERAAFEQLECLTGQYRCTLSGGAGGGISWAHLELAGVFLQHTLGGALVWLPEAGPNFLVRVGPEQWSLLEVARLGKEAVVVEQTKSRKHGKQAAIYGLAAMHRRWHRTVRERDASPHLTDRWLQAAEDLQRIWSWDWRAVREGSPFQLSHAKFVYTVGYPLSDKFVRGCHGEERWLWQWQEDGQGRLLIHNRSWHAEARLALSEEAAEYAGLGGERKLWRAAGA